MKTIAGVFGNQSDLGKALNHLESHDAIDDDNIILLGNVDVDADDRLTEKRVAPVGASSSMPGTAVTPMRPKEVFEQIDVSDEEEAFYTRTASGNASVIFVKVDDPLEGEVHKAFEDCNATRVTTLD
jgi:hypothetical protein